MAAPLFLPHFGKWVIRDAHIYHSHNENIFIPCATSVSCEQSRCGLSAAAASEEDKTVAVCKTCAAVIPREGKTV